MSFRLVSCLGAALLSLTGCVSLPAVDPDLPCTRTTPNEAASLAIMRSEGAKIAGTPFVSGNNVDLLKDGPATLAALKQAIAGAHSRIDMESYEFDGDVAQQFADLLLQKQAQGVKVHLIYDAWGSMDAPSALFERMRQGGIQIVDYNPFDPARLNTLDLNKRDHRKLLIIDGTMAVTGGVNISEVYKNRRHHNPATDPEKMGWRDTDVEITGPVVPYFEKMFLQTWQEQHGPALAPPPSRPEPSVGESDIDAIDGSPADGHPAIYRTLLTAMSVARHSIHLTTGFFVPTPDLVRAFECAAMRGVDVRLVVPAISDNQSSVVAGRSHYTELLKAGVHIYERQKAVLHAKTAVIDGVWSAVGSSNLDWRSVVFNNEIDAIILGPHFGGEMEALFQRDEAASTEITLDAWQHRGLGERLREQSARLIGFLL